MPSPSSNSVPCRGREGDFLPELNAYIKLTDTTRLFLLGSLTQHLSDGSTEGEVGVHLDVTLKPILRRELRQANWERSISGCGRICFGTGHTDDVTEIADSEALS